MTTLTVKIDGIEELKRALDGDMRKVMRIATLPIAHEVKRVVAKYPAATAANRPRSSVASRRSLSWYVRGWGTRWMSQKGRRWGDFKPPRPTKRDVRYGGYWGGVQTSEKLNRSWAVGRKGWGAYVGSRASYSPLVHSHREQAKFHGARGWVTDERAVEKVRRSGRMDRILKRAVDRVLKAKGGG